MPVSAIVNAANTALKMGKISYVQKHTSKDQRADKVVLVITTDGMENASREYTAVHAKRDSKLKTQ